MAAVRSTPGVEAEENNNEEEIKDITLPQVEVKIYNKSLLLKVQCENQQGILGKLFNEAEKYDLGLHNSSVMAFGPTAIDITIVGEMGDECRGQLKSLVEALYSVLETP